MEQLPTTIIQHVYQYDSTYRVKFDKVLKQMTAHCFIYNCHKYFKPWNSCYCDCLVCKTYLKCCHQTFYDEMNTYDDELEALIPLGV